MLPKGRIPPSIMIDNGFMIHFDSGIGLGIGFILQGTFVQRVQKLVSDFPIGYFLNLLSA